MHVLKSNDSTWRQGILAKSCGLVKCRELFRNMQRKIRDIKALVKESLRACENRRSEVQQTLFVGVSSLAHTARIGSILKGLTRLHPHGKSFRARHIARPSEALPFHERCHCVAAPRIFILGLDNNCDSNTTSSEHT